MFPLLFHFLLFLCVSFTLHANKFPVKLKKCHMLSLLRFWETVNSRFCNLFSCEKNVMQLRARKSTNTFCPHCRKTLWKHTFSHHARCVCVDSFVYSSDSLSRFLECASAFPPTGPPIHLPQLHAGFCCFKSFKNPPVATDGQAQRRFCAQLYWIYT